MENRKRLGIYLHIPFCVKKCNYCDFLSAPADEATRAAYVEKLKEEIRGFENAEDYLVDTVFVGGGTPSLLTGEQMKSVLDTVKERFFLTRDAEVTAECNPGTLTEEKAKAYREAGINRLSFGLQTTDNETLKILGRIHTYETFLDSFAIARKEGFDNINIDLMSSLPGQTKEAFETDLKRVTGLHPEHISAYSLMIEEGTPFFGRYGIGDSDKDKKVWPDLPDEETVEAIDRLTKSFLKEQGYLRYEISNYAKEGKECLHNLGYWYRKDYVGFGTGAASLLNPLRYRNRRELSSYIEGDFSKEEFFVLTKDNQIEETMYLGLRTVNGVSEETFAKEFRCRMDQVYAGELRDLTEQGLLVRENGRVFLSERGMDVSNPVLSRFLLD